MKRNIWSYFTDRDILVKCESRSLESEHRVKGGLQSSSTPGDVSANDETVTTDNDTAEEESQENVTETEEAASGDVSANDETNA